MTGVFLKMVPLLAMMGAVFFLSHQPGSAFFELPFYGADKLVHMGLYGAMAAAAVFAIPDTFRRRRKKTAAVITVIFCFVYGLSDEFHQSFVPGRDASVADLAADTVGALLLVAGWLMISKAGAHTQKSGDRM